MTREGSVLGDHAEIPAQLDSATIGLCWRYSRPPCAGGERAVPAFDRDRGASRCQSARHDRPCDRSVPRKRKTTRSRVTGRPSGSSSGALEATPPAPGVAVRRPAGVPRIDRGSGFRSGIPTMPCWRWLLRDDSISARYGLSSGNSSWWSRFRYSLVRHPDDNADLVGVTSVQQHHARWPNHVDRRRHSLSAARGAHRRSNCRTWRFTKSPRSRADDITTASTQFQVDPGQQGASVILRDQPQRAQKTRCAGSRPERLPGRGSVPG